MIRGLTYPVPNNIAYVAHARRAVRKALADWGHERIADDLVLVISELVTNSIIHGAPEIVLTLHIEGTTLFGAVTDHGPDLPHLLNPDDHAEHGRGLALVSDLVRTMGWCRASDGSKQVWFTYPLPEPP
ncbi:ATP-binding protein [Thermopolyspora sp. NPDC052614]|uniref:ATP-binding protein n=1 Tax=Thermopolyspora sp. NPDC052614 TaxID=3155682 RepID=UPI00342380BA